MDTHKLYFGGLPTEPDVKILWENILPEPGGEVAYADIAGLLRINVRNPRFRTVLNAWRRRLFRESNIDTKAIHGQGIRFLLDAERTRAGIEDSLSGIRKIGRANRRLMATPTEAMPPQAQRLHDHAQRLVSKMLEVGLQTCKQIALPPPTPIRPQMEPPGQQMA